MVEIVPAFIGVKRLGRAIKARTGDERQANTFHGRFRPTFQFSTVHAHPSAAWRAGLPCFGVAERDG